MVNCRFGTSQELSDISSTRDDLEQNEPTLSSLCVAIVSTFCIYSRENFLFNKLQLQFGNTRLCQRILNGWSVNAVLHCIVHPSSFVLLGCLCVNDSIGDIDSPFQDDFALNEIGSYWSLVVT